MGVQISRNWSFKNVAFILIKSKKPLKGFNTIFLGCQYGLSCSYIGNVLSASER